MNLTAILAALLFATAPPKPNLIELAHVNGEAVTAQQLISAFADRHSGHAKFLGGDLEARKFLDILINERLFIQEAFNIGLDDEPEARKKIDQYENEKASAALIAAEIDEKAKASEEQITAAWEKLDVVIQGREIAVGTRQEAEEIRAAILQGADIDALARTCSRVQTRSHGGAFLLNWGQREPEFERVVLPLQPGDISPVIETKDWFEVVIVDARHDVPKPDLKKVHDEIGETLRVRGLDERKDAWGRELFAKYHVVQQPVPAELSELVRLLATSPELVVATWDGGSLTLKDAVAADELRSLAPVPALRIKHEIEERLRAVINDSLVTREAKERKIADQPEVATAVQRFRELTAEDVLFRDHIWKDVTVNDDDLKVYYDSHKSEFVAPEQRRVAQIMVLSEADAKKVRGKLAAGADFEQLARTMSRDISTAGNGGDLGWITADKVPGAFKDVLTLKKGGVAKPARTASGWHIIKVVDIKPPHQLALAEVSDGARKGALDAKQRAAQKFWLEKLKAAAKIDVHDEAIKQFVKEYEFKGEAPPQHAMQ